MATTVHWTHAQLTLATLADTEAGTPVLRIDVQDSDPAHGEPSALRVVTPWENVRLDPTVQAAIREGTHQGPLDRDQEARVAALKEARQFLAPRGSMSTGAPTPDDLADLAQFILDGTHPAAWSRTDEQKD